MSNISSENASRFLSTGIWSGVLALGPMTVALFEIEKTLPPQEKSPLPPAIITDDLLKTIGVEKSTSTFVREEAAMLNHLAYGVACGPLYSALQTARPRSRQRTSPRPSLRAPVEGSIFGAAVWAASYLGWIPRAGFRNDATKMPWRRNAMMLGTHLIWGASLGIAEESLSLNRCQMLDGRRKAPAAE